MAQLRQSSVVGLFWAIGDSRQLSTKLFLWFVCAKRGWRETQKELASLQLHTQFLFSLPGCFCTVQSTYHVTYLYKACAQVTLSLQAALSLP